MSVALMYLTLLPSFVYSSIFRASFLRTVYANDGSYSVLDAPKFGTYARTMLSFQILTKFPFLSAKIDFPITIFSDTVCAARTTAVTESLC